MTPVVVTLVCGPTDRIWATQVAKLVEYAWLNAFATQIGAGSSFRQSRLSTVFGSGVPANDEAPSFGLKGAHRPHWHAAAEVPDVVVRVEIARVETTAPESSAAEAGLVLLLPSSRTDAVWRIGSKRPRPEVAAEAVLGEVSSVLSRARPGDPQVANYSGGQIWRVFSQLVGNPVRLAIAVPREVGTGTTFSARFAAYIAEREQGVVAQLKQLSAGLAEPAAGFVPDELSRWRKGTPVRVQLSSSTIGQPLEETFEWNGRDRIVTFRAAAPATDTSPTFPLRFEVTIEAVTVAVMTADVLVKQSVEPGVAATAAVTTVAPSESAFASYAKADGEAVSQCLSALVHWTPTLDIFMDCLDLTPNAEWQAELERVIPERRSFLLFWSRHARESRWVNWELDTAIRAHGVGGITPMPLEDPDLAPPPAALNSRHFRDRFQITREAFAKRRSG